MKGVTGHDRPSDRGPGRRPTRQPAADLAKKGILDGVSHELHHRMTRILGYLELLEDEDPGPLNARQRAMVAAVAADSRHVLTVGRDLLALVRLEAGLLTLDLRNVDLSMLVRAAAADVDAADSAPGAVTVGPIDAGPRLLGDVDILRRVFAEVISNILLLGPPPPRVDVTAHSEPGGMTVLIVGHGVRAPSRDPKLLLARHLHPSVQDTVPVGGPGSGVSLVERMVAGHGGTVTAMFTGDEARVRIQLPAARSGDGSGRPEGAGT
jgi:two-component system phosphate regulon sensor histidine kinase PhoR